MKYRVNVWGKSAFVSKGKNAVGMLFFDAPVLHLEVRGGEICATSVSSLFAFVKTLPNSVSAIRKGAKKSRHGKRWLEWRVDKSVLRFWKDADVAKVVRRVRTFIKNIGPLLELIEIICNRMKLKPLKNNATIRFYDCEEAQIDGMPVH